MHWLRSCGATDSTAAFEAVDLGSIPSGSTFYCTLSAGADMVMVSPVSASIAVSFRLLERSF